MPAVDPQTELWNGPSGDRWAQHFALTDRAFGPFGEVALERLNARPGERILDIGCGAGSSVLRLVHAVGAAGSVLGVDTSMPLTAIASQRCAAVPGASLLCADAACAELGAGYDAVFSNLGTMFFARPSAAFESLRRALAPGGRIVFTCWQSEDRNHWCSRLLEVVQPFMDEAPSTSSPQTPGTFAFADPSYIERLVTDAGFVNVAIEGCELPVPMGHGSVEQAVDFAHCIGPAASLSEKQTPEVQAQIRERLTSFFESVATGSAVTLPGAAWIVTATRP
ncbi:MAG: SAM-dependent methyltransferase [Bacteroidia bacterium]|jgi:SAM-dependent methyltransferase